MASLILLLYTRVDLEPIIGIASHSSWTGDDLAMVQSPTNVGHCIAAVVLLIAATVLAVYKPPGMTRYGQRKKREKHLARDLDKVG
ncbi:hypothetical protein ACFYTS_35090 [Nocardia sp. NPDC004151]|uniref:hypothetical protein n=1 Tax=Nocardia sp. NPDC004151 TaxID=3364304 RepID=UPI00369656B6